MRLGCKVDDRVDPRVFKNLRDVFSSGNVSSNKLVSGIVLNFRNVLQIPGIGEEIEVNHLDLRSIPQNVSNETGTDKSCSTGNEDLHCCLSIEAAFCIAARGTSSGLPSCWLATRILV